MALYAFDGTTKNAKEDPERVWTNVRRFGERYDHGCDTEPWYWDGVGRRLGRTGECVGGLTGVGTEVRVNEARAVLFDKFSGGDEVIDIVGYSRGAATAAAFAWAIFHQGVREPRSTWTGRWGPGGFSGKMIAERPPIRFVGLFDMVFTTQGLQKFFPFWESLRTNRPIAGPAGGFRSKSMLRGDLSLPESVGAAFHALSIHERRKAYNATRIANAYEVWFPGDHSDIGGGDKERQITDTTLRWMIRQARGVGVPVEEDDRLRRSGGGLSDAVRSDRTPLVREIRPGDRVFETATSLPQVKEIDSLEVEPASWIPQTD